MHLGRHVHGRAAHARTHVRARALERAREAEVDDLLRGAKFVDLYRVVAESIRTSEPRYSIKNMEAFYLPGGRQGEVKNAGDSIIIYERWRRLGDEQLLRSPRRRHPRRWEPRAGHAMLALRWVAAAIHASVTILRAAVVATL